MSIFHIFKKSKGRRNGIILQGSATLYPDKILVETINRVKDAFGISSTNITILPVDVDLETLGSTIRHHLSLTKNDVSMPKDFKKHYKDFLHRAGFKNGNEHHRNALQLSISQSQNQIRIIPTKNGGYTGKDRGFIGIKEADISIDANSDYLKLAHKIKEGWAMCECNNR
jgi:hypothetical protein